MTPQNVIILLALLVFCCILEDTNIEKNGKKKIQKMHLMEMCHHEKLWNVWMLSGKDTVAFSNVYKTLLDGVLVQNLWYSWISLSEIDQKWS